MKILFLYVHVNEGKLLRVNELGECTMYSLQCTLYIMY